MFHRTWNQHINRVIIGKHGGKTKKRCCPKKVSVRDLDTLTLAKPLFTKHCMNNKLQIFWPVQLPSQRKKYDGPPVFDDNAHDVHKCIHQFSYQQQLYNVIGNLDYGKIIYLSNTNFTIFIWCTSAGISLSVLLYTLVLTWRQGAIYITLYHCDCFLASSEIRKCSQLLFYCWYHKAGTVWWYIIPTTLQRKWLCFYFFPQHQQLLWQWP